MPVIKSESKSDPKPDPGATAARRRGRRQPSPPQTIPNTGEMRALMQQRKRLFAEARQNPDSEAAEIIQMFALSGMLAGQAAATISADPTRGQLERRLREQRERLDKVAQAAEQAKAEQWDETAIYNRIAEIVGLRAPLQMYRAPQERDQQVSDAPSEDICQTQPSPNPKS